MVAIRVFGRALRGGSGRAGKDRVLQLAAVSLAGVARAHGARGREPRRGRATRLASTGGQPAPRAGPRLRVPGTRVPASPDEKPGSRATRATNVTARRRPPRGRSA